MKPELQDKLYKKYPNLFSNKDLPMDQTCMCWGIETDDGWYDLLDETCGKLIKYKIKFDQVKEKFGSIRIYYSWDSGSFTWYEKLINIIAYNKYIRKLTKILHIKLSDDRVFDIIAEAEDKSVTICEECGKEGVMCIKGGWLKTLCEDHRKQNGYNPAKI